MAMRSSIPACRATVQGNAKSSHSQGYPPPKFGATSLERGTIKEDGASRSLAPSA